MHNDHATLPFPPEFPLRSLSCISASVPNFVLVAEDWPHTKREGDGEGELLGWIATFSQHNYQIKMCLRISHIVDGVCMPWDAERGGNAYWYGTHAHMDVELRCDEIRCDESRARWWGWKILYDMITCAMKGYMMSCKIQFYFLQGELWPWIWDCDCVKVKLFDKTVNFFVLVCVVEMKREKFKRLETEEKVLWFDYIKIEQFPTFF